MATKICPVCGAEFEIPQNKPQKEYCSTKCQKRAWYEEQKAIRKANPRMIKCAICGKEFHPTHPRQKVCTDVHTHPCAVCGKPVPYRRPSEIQKTMTCSEECRRELQRRTNVDRRGVSYPMQSAEVRKNHEAAMLSAHGVEHALQSEEFKEKAKQTIRDHFGTDWALQSPEVQAKRKATMLERYGVEYPTQMPDFKEKSKKTVQERYRVDCIAHSPEIQAKRIETNIKKYGFPSATQNYDVKKKIRASRIKNNGSFWTDAMQAKAVSTCRKKYGVDNPFSSDEIKEKIAQVWMDRCGVRHHMQDPKYRKRVEATMLRRYGVPYYILTDDYRQNESHSVISKTNVRFGKIFGDLGYEYEFEKTIGLKSYDIHLIGHNILIEINPTYTHSQIPPHFSAIHIPTDYHYTKTKLANESGYRCIHIFDWDDVDVLKRMLSLNKQEISSADCECHRIQIYLANEFLSVHHISGESSDHEFGYGLYYNDTLVSVMTFKETSCEDYDIVRFCVHSDYDIPDAVNRIINHFTSMMNVKEVTAYCDIAKFTGDEFANAGFRCIKYTDQRMIWSKKRWAVEDKHDSHDWDLLISDGWKPVYDCGSMIFVYTVGK